MLGFSHRNLGDSFKVLAMNIPALGIPSTTLIITARDFDANVVPALRVRFAQCVENETGDVIVDMSTVNFIDSSGIGALVLLFKRLAAMNRRMEVHGLHGQPWKLIKLLRIDRSISCRTQALKEAS
jgi:anti-anti-sigma factor